MKIGITGDRGALCLRIAEFLSEELGVGVDKISLFGDEWKSLTFDHDVLIHIAGVIPGNNATTESFYAVNRDLTEAVAKKAAKDGVKHLIYFSTMAVYGVQPSIGRGGTVSCNTPVAPKDDYGKSKYEGEEKIRAFEGNGYLATYLRIPSVYFENQTAFLNVAREMYDKVPFFFPKLCTKHSRSAIYGESLCKLILLIIEKGQGGIICPADAPQLSLYDYMNIINSTKEKKKRSSRLLGLIFKGVMLVKPSWKSIFGRVCFDDESVNVFEGEYHVLSSREAILSCLEQEKTK